jgi:hypothetical protein
MSLLELRSSSPAFSLTMIWLTIPSFATISTLNWLWTNYERDFLDPRQLNLTMTLTCGQKRKMEELQEMRRRAESSIRILYDQRWQRQQ